MIFDVESDGLLDELTVIHTLHVIDTSNGQRLRFNDGFFANGDPAPRDGSLEEGFRLLMKQKRLIGHNIIGFDIPAIQKVYPWFTIGDDVELMDTMVMARLRWPDIRTIDAKRMKSKKLPADFGKRGLMGTHKLEAWGIRLGVLKNDYDGEWTYFTQEMEDYAAQDPVTTEALWLKCLDKMDWCEADELEHRTQDAICMQMRFGFAFDKEGAEKLAVELQGRKAELMDGLRAAFPPWEARVMKGGKPYTFVPKRDNKKLGYKAGVGVPKFKTMSFNPGSRQQIADRLKTLYGWTPVEFTPSGQPKVDESTLASLDHIPEAALLIDYLTVDKRLGQVRDGDKAWLNYVVDGRIHGFVNPLGAITRRMTHSGPNVGQVPSLFNAKGPVPYGKECRQLWGVSLGAMIGGCDAEGLELRMLAHYMAKDDGGAYGDTVVNGDKSKGTDVHTMNQKLIKLNSRDGAKTWIYAYLYGAGLLKLGMIIYEDYTAEQREAFNAKWAAGSVREKKLAQMGKAAKGRIEAGLPALGKLQARVKRLAGRDKALQTLDGSKLPVRHQHAALNTLLQGGGAVVMKKALVLFVDQLKAMGFVPNRLTGAYVRGEDVIGLIANVHDEFQMELPPHLADEIGEVAKNSIRDAGLAFNMRCPLAGSFDKGTNWAESH